MSRINAAPANSLALFCKVVDNYGDIGICWRLARQLVNEHGLAVSLWVDDLRSFRRMCPAIDIDADVQNAGGVTIHHWRTQEGEFLPHEVADIVIEFFACDIPPGYVDAMARRDPKPVWFNLEGLSAEDWVEGCHTLPSMHPRLPLTKYFFFPGFTGKTGGLLHEAGLEEERRCFQEDPAAIAGFLGRLGATPSEIGALKISLFCYPHAPVEALFGLWQGGQEAVACFVPEGIAAPAVQTFFGGPAKAGDVRTQDALTVRVVPFVPQPDYDRLLWSCDLNFVRGEDSFVRAQWAQRPFIWHIYPQDKNLHHVKLRAFLRRYCPDIDSLADFSLCWNEAQTGDVAWPALWARLRADFPHILNRAADWETRVLAHGELAGNLLRLAASLKSLASENKV